MSKPKRAAFPGKCVCCNVESIKCGKTKGPYRPKKRPWLDGVPKRVPWRNPV
jgi:hypothetical protein